MPLLSLRLALEGDVEFVVGGATDSTTILASSVILSNASPVFRTLLKDVPRDTTFPEHISIPDDDARAFADLCSALHVQNAELNALKPSYTAARRLLELCVLADKYQCAEQVCFVVDALMTRFAGSPPTTRADITIWHYLAAAAYVLQLPERFTHFTEGLIKWSWEPFEDRLGERCGEVLTLTVLRALEKERNRARTRLVDDVYDIASIPCRSSTHDNSYCPLARCKKVVYHVAAHVSANKWPPNFTDMGGCLETLLRSVAAVPTIKFRPYWPCWQRGEHTITANKFERLSAKIKQEIVGLCLDCMLEGHMEGQCIHQ